MLKWLNPANWIKSAIASRIEEEIEKRLTREELETIGRNIVNYIIELSQSRLNDDKVREISQDLVFCANALADLGTAINPDGEKGRKISEQEAASLNARVKVLFGDIVTESELKKLRKIAVDFVREKMGA